MYERDNVRGSECLHDPWNDAVFELISACQCGLLFGASDSDCDCFCPVFPAQCTHYRKDAGLCNIMSNYRCTESGESEVCKVKLILMQCLAIWIIIFTVMIMRERGFGQRISLVICFGQEKKDALMKFDCRVHVCWWDTTSVWSLRW